MSSEILKELAKDESVEFLELLTNKDAYKSDETLNNSLFLMWAVSTYLSDRFSDEILEPNQIEEFITDQVASEMLGHRASKQLEDDGIDAVVMVDENGGIILSASDPDSNDVSDVYLFQSKDSKIEGTRDELGKMVQGYNDFLLRDGKDVDKKLDIHIGSIFGSTGWRGIKNARVHFVVLISRVVTEEQKIAVTSRYPQCKVEVIDKNDFRQMIVKRDQPSRTTDPRPLKVFSRMHHPFNSVMGAVSTGNVYLSDWAEFLKSGVAGESSEIEEGLFLDNVRGDRGKKVEANKGIRKTLKEGTKEFGGDFWWLSNGITILVDKVTTESENSVMVTNPQIINGQQTSRAVFDVVKLEKNDVPRDWSVSVRIIELPNTVEDEETLKTVSEFRSKIITGLNTQTAIAEFEIHAQNRSVENIFKALLSDNIFLIRRKGEDGKLSERMRNALQFITYEELAKFTGVAKFDYVSQARSSTKTFLKGYQKQIYDKSDEEEDFWIEMARESISFKNFWAQFLERKLEKIMPKTGDDYAMFPVFWLFHQFMKKKEGDHFGSFAAAINSWHGLGDFLQDSFGGHYDFASLVKKSRVLKYLQRWDLWQRLLKEKKINEQNIEDKYAEFRLLTEGNYAEFEQDEDLETISEVLIKMWAIKNEEVQLLKFKKPLKLFQSSAFDSVDAKLDEIFKIESLMSTVEKTTENVAYLKLAIIIAIRKGTFDSEIKKIIKKYSGSERLSQLMGKKEFEKISIYF